EALREFRGAPHRLELVRELDGVRYINDTTATAPHATIAALQTLAPRGGKIFLIAGGADKGLPYDGLAKVILETNAQVILLAGSATEKIERALIARDARAQIAARAQDLAQALAAGKSLARAGDAVLLSPGAASFGMFANEFERGDIFRALALAL
ncbi:MAG: hypothetical protein B6D41_14540, partial [Chloroflexi bacterium UTCFX4]